MWLWFVEHLLKVLMGLTRVLEIPTILCTLLILVRLLLRPKWLAAPWAKTAENVAFGIIIVFGVSVLVMGYILMQRY